MVNKLNAVESAVFFFLSSLKVERKMKEKQTNKQTKKQTKSYLLHYTEKLRTTSLFYTSLSMQRKICINYLQKFILITTNFLQRSKLI